MHYYYRHQNNKPPSIPTTATDVEDIVARSTRVIKDRERITSEEMRRNNNDNVEKAIEGLEADNKKKNNQQNKKNNRRTMVRGARRRHVFKHEKKNPHRQRQGLFHLVMEKNVEAGMEDLGGHQTTTTRPH